MAKRKKKRRAGSTKRTNRAAQHRVRWVVGGIAAVVILGAGLWYALGRQPAPSSEPISAPADLADENSVNFPYGGASYCRAGPRFAAEIGFPANRAYIGTSLRGYTGLTLSDAADPSRVYQDPSWDDAGHLGAWVYDRDGNLYVAPAPFVSLEANPPAEQNRIYKVDTNTGAMTFFLDLPAVRPPDANNPFGVMGLFYDCDTHSLYAGSVAGSSAAEELGRIYRIDPATGEVVDMLDGFDALGVGVFNHADGKRLYAGRGRDTGLYAVALDPAGNFTEEPTVELFLAAFDQGGSNDRIQRITFNQANEMILKGLPFSYNLQAVSQPPINLYSMAYTGNANTAAGDAPAAWTLIAVERQPGQP